MAYFEKFPTTHCNGKTTLTFYDGEAVRVNQTLKVKTHGHKKIQCWYRNILYRKDVFYVYEEWNGPFTHSINVDPNSRSEYVHAQCKDGNGQLLSDMYHYATRAEIRKRTQPTAKNIFKEDQLNVMLVGLDSLAKFLFTRAMPKTRKYLTETLNAFELRKYNKVGDNTFPNLLAILTGLFESEPKNWSISEGFDALPFVWNDYKRAGYRTGYVSDRVDFNDFVKPPTDVYTLPLHKAFMKGMVDFDHDCIEDKNEVEMWLEYLTEFARDSMFATGRFWVFSFINRPTHDFPNKASAVDERYLTFMKELHESNILNNTLLILFGDHGPRITSYRKTVLGSIEERAPAMFLYFPQWFRDKYPLHMKNLMINQDRLTTNFDVHATLKALLNVHEKSHERPEGKEKRKTLPRGFSLFTEIPLDRTCEQADVDPHYCLCHGGVTVVDPVLRREVGEQVVKDMNAILRPVKGVCAELRLRDVITMGLLKGYPRGSATYRIMLSTEPGDAQFEATVEYNVKALVFKSLKTLGAVSRINMYRGQSDCVKYDKMLRMFCYCKKLLTKQGNITTRPSNV